MPTVLIIDDEPMNLLALDAILSNIGIRADQMNSGVKAVAHIHQLVKNGQPLYKVILCDFSMPQLDGPQTAIQIHKICKGADIDCPFIACVTAY